MTQPLDDRDQPADSLESAAAPVLADAAACKDSDNGEATQDDPPAAIRNGNPANPAVPIASLPIVPGYEPIREIGRGKFGVVFEATHLASGQRVALKILRPEALSTRHGLDRFKREAAALKEFHHANIVKLIDVGDAGGQPFLALEYADGGNLKDKLDNMSFPTNAAARIIEAARLIAVLADAIQHAHEHRRIHRDLKPANIFLMNDGTVKIGDFGVAKWLEGITVLTHSGDVIGTPSYMAPEQADGKANNAREPADVYALGAILYELLTGKPPFQGASVPATLYQVKHKPPEPPIVRDQGVPRQLNTICLKCLQKDPLQRYATARELADDIRRFLAGEPIKAMPIAELPIDPPTRGTWRRNAVVACFVVVLCVALLLVGMRWGKNPPPWQQDLDRCERQVDMLATVVGGQQPFLKRKAQLPGNGKKEFTEVEEWVDQLHVAVGEDLEGRFKVAALRARLAKVAFQLGQRQDAERIIGKAISTLDVLKHADPPEPRHVGLWAEAIRIRGLLQLFGNKAKEGMGDLDAAFKAIEPYANDGAPAECRLTLARIRMVQANLYKFRGDKKSAKEAYVEARDAAEGASNAVAGDDDANWKERRAASFTLAEVLSNAGELLGPPEEIHLKALQLRKKIVDDEPGNPQFQAYLAASHNWLGNTYATQKRFAEAVGHYTTALKILEELAEKNPGIPAFQQERDEVRQNLKLLAPPEPAKEAATQKFTPPPETGLVPTHALREQSGPVKRIVFAPDGSRLISASISN